MTSKERLLEAFDRVKRIYVTSDHYDEEDINILQELIDQQSILEEYNVTPEILREVLLTGQMFRLQPAFFECVKEWKNKGWTYRRSRHFKWFFVEKDYKKICFDCNKITYSCSKIFDIDLELNDLIKKTLKALGNNNETK